MMLGGEVEVAQDGALEGDSSLFDASTVRGDVVLERLSNPGSGLIGLLKEENAQEEVPRHI